MRLMFRALKYWAAALAVVTIAPILRRAVIDSGMSAEQLFDYTVAYSLASLVLATCYSVARALIRLSRGPEDVVVVSLEPLGRAQMRRPDAPTEQASTDLDEETPATGPARP